MAYTKPSVAQFKALFPTDFTYNADPLIGVTDTQIQNAIDISFFNINSSFWADQSQFDFGELYLAAHYLVTTLRQISVGKGGSYSGIVSSKSVGSVSVGYSIPQSFLDNPMYTFYLSTSYGMFYLEMIYPYLHGQVFVVCGETLP